ncbi:MAG: hypothetical protein AB1420_16000 [Bacillota bacterium]
MIKVIDKDGAIYEFKDMNEAMHMVLKKLNRQPSDGKGVSWNIRVY